MVCEVLVGVDEAASQQRKENNIIFLLLSHGSGFRTVVIGGSHHDTPTTIESYCGNHHLYDALPHFPVASVPFVVRGHGNHEYQVFRD
jgi:hypothetical protein